MLPNPLVKLLEKVDSPTSVLENVSVVEESLDVKKLVLKEEVEISSMDPVIELELSFENSDVERD